LAILWSALLISGVGDNAGFLHLRGGSPAALEAGRFGNEMRSATLLGIAVVALTSMQPAYAQMESACEDHCKINTNLAGVVNVPLNPTAQLVTVGWGLVGGVGYNFNKRHAFIAEFMFNRTYPEGDSLQPLKTVLQASNLNAYTDFYVLTGNYRFELRGQFFGAYLIGGGGLYVRYSHLSQSVTVVGTGIPCTQSWLWWGFNCSAGFVTASQTLASATSSVGGGNAGAGMTFRVGGAPYRIYTEARYHYAPTRHINSQFVTVAVGLRY
jgi:Outer membrane protein beta-barrel domain